MRKSIFLMVIVALLPLPARACLNDRDSLAEEAQWFPNAVRVITGRFPRNPPLYYKMRIERVRAEIAERPNELGLYDDVAVAADRTGDDDTALAVMSRKLARMKALKTPGNAGNSGDTPWYRYNANTGTFLVHRYLRNPGKYPLSDVKNGRRLIAESIRVNPKAHFGREKVQLAVMNWILQGSTIPLGDYLWQAAIHESTSGVGIHQTLEEWRRGLEGLIVMGNAWESPDAFSALSTLLQRNAHKEMAQFAAIRTRELIENGARPMYSGANLPAGHSSVDGPRWSPAANFQSLRREAEDWHTARTAYMMERLGAGRHPDTDPTFWADWHEPPAPTLADRPLPLKRVPNTLMEWWQFGLFSLVFGGIGVGLIRQWRQTGFQWSEATLLFFAALLVLLLLVVT